MDNLKTSGKIGRERLFFLGFIYSLGILTASFLISFLFFKVQSTDYVFSFNNPICFTDIRSAVTSVSTALIPCVCTLALIFCSAFTPVGGIISCLSVIWRGASLGCVIATVSSKIVLQVGRYSAASVLLYFSASVVILAASSMATVYRRQISGAYSEENYGYAATLSARYIKHFLVLAGAAYVLSSASIILFHTR